MPEDYELQPQPSGKWGNEVKYCTEYKLTNRQLYWRRSMIDEVFDGDIGFFTQEYPATLDECFQAQRRFPPEPQLLVFVLGGLCCQFTFDGPDRGG